MLRNKAAIDSLEEAESILFALAQTIEQRTATQRALPAFGQLRPVHGLALGLPQPELLALHRGAYLHDIARSASPIRSCSKPASAAIEWSIMRDTRSRRGDLPSHEESFGVLPVIRHHHERWDGSGYPMPARREYPLLARICKWWTSTTPLPPSVPTTRPQSEESLAILQLEAERGWRDPELVSLFREISGSVLAPEVLSDSEQAEEADMRTSLENMRRNFSSDPPRAANPFPPARRAKIET